MREIIPYNSKLKDLAKKLRNNSTLSEAILWKYLHQKKMKGYDFDRQKPMLEYIIDFYCKELKLAIEIDGNSHNYDAAFEADIVRQNEIEAYGVQFIRFTDKQVKLDLLNVLVEIETWIDNNKII
jgi:very-short-patch-repair endonuclease